MQLDAAVQGCLSAESEQYPVGAFFFDDTFDEIWRYRQEVYLVGKSVGGLHGGDVGVDQDSGDAFFLEGFEGLRAGVVEFAGFADF